MVNARDNYLLNYQVMTIWSMVYETLTKSLLKTTDINLVLRGI